MLLLNFIPFTSTSPCRPLMTIFIARFYLLKTGKVVLECDGEGEPTVIQTLGPGDVLGWSWLFPPFTWHFLARALQPTRAIALDGAPLLVLCNRDPHFGFELMKRVSQVVIQRLQAARRRQLEHSPATTS
jgi:CRP-like cAMP-binding protein